VFSRVAENDPLITNFSRKNIGHGDDIYGRDELSQYDRAIDKSSKR
jgi:hypothetical protein